MDRRTRDYMSEAQSDAAEMARNFLDEIVRQVLDGERVSKDLLNHYPGGDSYQHERHVDRAYNLSEATDLLETLYRYEETDSGLWDSLPPREAIGVQAAYTYGNAVYHLWRDLIGGINSERESGVLGDYLSDCQEEGRDPQEGIVRSMIEDAIKRWEEE